MKRVAERVLLGLVRAGDETVQRDRDMTPELARRASSVGGPCGHRRGIVTPGVEAGNPRMLDGSDQRESFASTSLSLIHI